VVLLTLPPVCAVVVSLTVTELSTLVVSTATVVESVLFEDPFPEHAAKTIATAIKVATFFICFLFLIVIESYCLFFSLEVTIIMTQVTTRSTAINRGAKMSIIMVSRPEVTPVTPSIEFLL
jgi:hypothetical protein